jgi:histidine ammonia-lyase
MLLRINSLARGQSGVRAALIDRLIEMLNGGIHPQIPEKGSVGASGDLAPLAYLAAALIGHPNANVVFRGTRMAARIAFLELGLEPQFQLQAKEGLAMLNGTSVSTAIAALALIDAELLLESADIALALTMEAARAQLEAFDARIHEARPHRGQVETAANIRRLLEGTRRCSTAAREIVIPGAEAIHSHDVPRLQDAYSIRCAPQVHGPVRDAIRYARGIVNTEINSAVDNPLIFSKTAESGNFEVLSGGNFHGQYIAQASDLITMAVTDLGSISERRAARLIDASSGYGLPQNLVSEDIGLNTGYSIAQCTMSALLAENRTLSWPASVDSIPTKSNQEDHISNSTWCARKAQQVVDNTITIVSIEALIAAQALSICEPHLRRFPLAPRTRAIYETIRSKVPATAAKDIWMHDLLASILRIFKTGVLVDIANNFS